MSINIRQLKELYTRYERWLIPGALVFGVIVDFVTFKSIQIGTAFLVLGAHMLIAAGAIALLNARKWLLIAPLALQFSFGALLSASFIFYWFSGSLSVSWPILALLAVLMASNEVLRHWFERPVIQFTVFFFILFSIGTLVFPYAFNSIEETMFVLAGVISLIVIALFVFALERHLAHLRALRPRIATGVIGVFALMNLLYLFNIIPPIPLSLREAGVYHLVERQGGVYSVTEEKRHWIDRLLPGQTIHIEKGRSVYVYASVFAPAKLNTTIYHRWQYYDEKQSRWVDTDRLSYTITGGRDEGYRGYSRKSALAAGKWRVGVETERGQTLARIGFRVEYASDSPEFVEVMR